jgi:hypothetical protein
MSDKHYTVDIPIVETLKSGRGITEEEVRWFKSYAEEIGVSTRVLIAQAIRIYMQWEISKGGKYE